MRNTRPSPPRCPRSPGHHAARRYVMTGTAPTSAAAGSHPRRRTEHASVATQRPGDARHCRCERVVNMHAEAQPGVGLLVSVKSVDWIEVARQPQQRPRRRLRPPDSNSKRPLRVPPARCDEYPIGTPVAPPRSSPSHIRDVAPACRSALGRTFSNHNQRTRRSAHYEIVNANRAQLGKTSTASFVRDSITTPTSLDQALDSPYASDSAFARDRRLAWPIPAHRPHSFRCAYADPPNTRISFGAFSQH